ncbi:MAG TPA: hypothetical protein DCM14_06285 [Clostridiales bacterium UBA8153]|nr:hypothetical protein [Clostridiales bacterium UBA8153]
MEVRRSARGVVLSEEGQILLFKFVFERAYGQKVLWITPGGELKSGEDYADALIREVTEETGFALETVGPWIWTRRIPIEGVDSRFTSYERYFLLKPGDMEVSIQNLTAAEKSMFRDYRWWDIDEILASGEEFAPPNLAELVRDLLSGNVPAHPMDID